MSLCLTCLPGTLRRSPFGRRELDTVMRAMLIRADAADALIDLALLDDAAVQTLHEAALGCPGPTNILSFPASDGAREQADAAGPHGPGEAAGGQCAAFAGRPCADDEALAGAPAPTEREYIGSLALSVDTLRREAFLYGQPVDEHAVRLLAHGLAHLLGYDHGPAMDALTASLEEAGLAEAARLLQA